MDIWNETIIPRLQHVTALEYFTFAVNTLVFLFSKTIASHYGEIKDEAKMRTRLRILHGFNFTVFITFMVSLIIKDDRFPADQISQTSLTLLLTYLLIHLAEVLLLSRYGKSVTVMGFTRKVETSTSRTLELVACGVILISMLIVLINIWGLTSSLQTTGVIGFLALLIFTTKDYWLRDFLSGILLISEERLQRGDVVSIPSENVLGIVLEIRGIQTSIRDLVRSHDIEIPNSSLLKNRVDLYKENPGGPFRDYVDFKIGYGTASEKVRKFLQKVFDQALKSGAGIDQDVQPSITLKENADHAARWRISYVLKNPQKLLAARDAINLAAYELQNEAGLSVSTPLTLIMENKD